MISRLMFDECNLFTIKIGILYSIDDTKVQKKNVLSAIIIGFSKL